MFENEIAILIDGEKYEIESIKEIIRENTLLKKELKSIRLDLSRVMEGLQ